MQRLENKELIVWSPRNELQHIATKLPVCNIYMVLATEFLVCCIPILTYPIDNHLLANLFRV